MVLAGGLEGCIEARQLAALRRQRGMDFAKPLRRLGVASCASSAVAARSSANSVPRFTQAARFASSLATTDSDARQIERIDDRLRLGGHFDSFVFSSTSVDRRLRCERRPDALDNFKNFAHSPRTLF
jgi:hypothetical protein